MKIKNSQQSTALWSTAMLVTATLATVTLTTAAPAVADIETGPDVGSPIPSFEVRDQQGELRTFEDLRGPNGLLLLFHRSADW